MASPLDIIALPGHPGMFARRVAVEAWQAAGSPHANSAGRLYSLQKHFWDGWRRRLPGFQPADNPDDETQALAHCRFVAFDIDPTADRIRRLTAAGMIRPYWYEPWHWELRNVRSYAIVRSIPATAGGDITPIEPEELERDEDEMYVIDDTKLGGTGSVALAHLPTGLFREVTGNEGELGAILAKSYKEAALLAPHEYRWLKAECARIRAQNPAGTPTAIDYAALAKAVNDDAARRLAS